MNGKTPIFYWLPVGRQNSVPLKLICSHFLLSGRDARREIARERKAGALILSTSAGTGGYWRADETDAGELEVFATEMRSRGLDCLQNAQMAARAAKRIRQAKAAEQSAESAPTVPP